MQAERRIVCVHLLDDFSGASNVCAQVIGVLKAEGHSVRVLTGSGGEGGFIRKSHLTHSFYYRFSESRLLMLLRFAFAQLAIFARVVHACLVWQADTVYVSTVLPAGAALAGALCRRRVVTHLHEVGMSSPSLFRLLLGSSVRYSDTVICVSEFVASTLKIPASKVRVVHNSLDPSQWATATTISQQRPHDASPPFVAVMACSLKWYKGLDSFFALAQELAVYQLPVEFRLLVNSEQDAFDQFCVTHPPPSNLRLTRRPDSVMAHYAQAQLVVNLSHSEGWVETFGLTLLEAMACGVPVVSPRVGGCIEVVRDGDGGWLIDSRAIAALRDLILRLAGDTSLWSDASRRARASAERFTPAVFKANLLKALA